MIAKNCTKNLSIESMNKSRNFFFVRYKNRNFHEIPTVPQMAHGPGFRHGLEVELNNDVDDYFYTTMETTGFKVHFFLCRDFPDVLSGSLKEFLVGVGQQTLFNVEVDVIKSTPQIKSIPINMVTNFDNKLISIILSLHLNE